jgi:transcriptional regulator PpsR
MPRFKSPAESIGDLDALTAARVIAACGDVAMVIDRHGIIRDVALSSTAMEIDAAHMLDRRWIDTVTSDSRGKVEDLLRAAFDEGEARWREVNHVTSQGSTLVRYLALDLGRDGKVIALGRDLSRFTALQQRLLYAQQEVEREHMRARQTESLYRLLFNVSSEAVLIVDAGSRRIVEANAQASTLLGLAPLDLAGQTLAKLFHPESRDALALLLHEGGRADSVKLRAADGRQMLQASATPFRQDRAAMLLVRLSPLRVDTNAESDAAQKLVRVLNRIPDAFVMTDQSFAILEANLAFLELSHCATIEAARATPLAAMLGRPNVDLEILAQSLRDHGWVRRFETTLTPLYGESESIEISGVMVQDGLETLYGLTLRPLARPPVAASAADALPVPQSAAEIRDLVGRVPLRAIVRDTTDVIERLCIEAALELTANNRASAAEMLGLSRQSLYSKLDRYGVGGPEDAAADEPD